MAPELQDVSAKGHSPRTYGAGAGKPPLPVRGTGRGTSMIGKSGKDPEPLAHRDGILAAELIGGGKSGPNGHGLDSTMLRPVKIAHFAEDAGCVLTARKEPPYFGFPLWAGKARFLLALVPRRRGGVFGHSLSGVRGLKPAAENPRVTRVLASVSGGTDFTGSRAAGPKLRRHAGGPLRTLAVAASGHGAAYGRTAVGLEAGRPASG